VGAARGRGLRRSRVPGVREEEPLEGKPTLRNRFPTWEAVAFAAGAAVVVAVSVVVGWSVPTGSRLNLVLPLAGLVGLGLTVLAFTRFELFLMLVLAARASLDVAKLSASSVDATGALSVLFIVASVVWLYRHRTMFRRPSPVSSLVPPFAAFFGVAALSIVFSSHPLDSALEAVRVGTVVVIVITLSRVVQDRESARPLLLAIFASALLPLAAGVLQIARGGAGITAAGIGRIDGTFLHPNPFAAYLSLLMILAVAVIPHVDRIWRWALAVLALVSGVVLVSTYARGAWIATFAGLLVVALLQHRQLLWLMGAAIVVVALFIPSVQLRVSDLSESRSASGASANSLAWRIEYWDRVLALQDNPLLGIGLREVELNEEAAKAPHNDFIRVYVETGILGLAAYLWLLWALFAQARLAYRSAATGLPRGLAIAFLGTVTAVVVLSITANVVSQLVILWYFGAIVVAASASAELTSGGGSADA
jgi:putative inorganic carbon (hco3(-)) transporter